VPAGQRASFEIPAGAARYVAIRARDEQGNFGRVALVDRGPGAGRPRPGLRPGRCANRRAGGRGPDHLHGSRAGDRLLGFRGRDVLEAFVGRDCLNGGRSRDRMLGGRGPDLLKARDGRRDLVDCGRGRDRAFADRRDLVRRCERRRPRF
jgi:Ca2+-binding RTX toxin-like protein